MNSIQYILFSTICLSICYSVFRIIYRNGGDFRQMRLTLMASILLSLLIPFNSYRIELEYIGNQMLMDNLAPRISQGGEDNLQIPTKITIVPGIYDSYGFHQSAINWPLIFKKIYIIVFLLLFTRLLARFGILFVQFYRAERKKDGRFIIASDSSIKNSFSFFNWIFINPASSSKEETEQIIFHEKIHASQYHSLDLILIELLAAVMWFNPLVWMMRNSLQLVHEYLADEGALNTGISKLRYQALLINQTAEGSLICLSSSFNNSLIKKRMIMMNKANFSPGAKYKILALLPLTAILLFGVACIKGQDKSSQVTAVELVRMNVLYVGAENPVKIAASGYETTDLIATIDNGTITGSNGEYVISPKETGKATLTVSCKGKEIQKTEFRVKFVPDPEAMIGTGTANRNDGFISKGDLLKAGGIIVEMRNFDFDLSFKVKSFVLSASVPNSNVIREEISKSDKFSEMQIDLLKSLVKFQKLMVEEIIVSGPDGKERKLSPMVFNISGE